MKNNRRISSNNILHLTQTVRLYTTEEEMKKIDRTFEIRRFLYNKCLEKVINDYNIDFNKLDYNTKINIKLSDIKKYATTFIRKEYKHILEETSSLILNPLLEDLIKSIEGLKFRKGKRLYFKSKNKSFTFSLEKKNERSLKIKCINNQYYLLLQKHGWIKISNNIRFNIKDKDIRRIHVNKKGNKYYAYIVCEIDKSLIKEKSKTNKTIAFDWGIKDYLIGWDGNNIIKFNFDQKILDKYNKKISYLTSIISRKGKNSKNRLKLINSLNKNYNSKHNYIINEINIFINSILDKYDNIILEDLNIKNGNNPIVNIKNKINKKILDRPFYIFKDKCKKISLKYNKNVFLVDKYYPSTQMCSNCGNIKSKEDKLSLNDRIYKCNKCGYEENRDINAAKNIYNCRELTKL